MSDKVQLIREEIERLKNHTLNIQKSTNGLITSVGRGRVEAFNDILKFIDFLQDKPDADFEHVDRITHSEEVINDDSENSSFYTVSNIETKHQPTENSNDEILRIFNKRRPYCLSDFKKRHFIDKLPK